MNQLRTKMDAEYTRIRKTAAQDPGTAGDEGEENWAQLLREWLPKTYQVVTKGQLIDERGNLSPQLDIIILKPTYPAALHHKKKYFIAGVAAVFECKLTLKKNHIYESVRTAATVKRLSTHRTGTPYLELMTGPIFGVVAHAHSWSSKQSSDSAIEITSKHLYAADLEHVNHPRETLDLLCISNLATWVTSKQPLTDPKDEIDDEARARLDPKGTPSTTYMCHAGQNSFIYKTTFQNFSPIGVFISELLVKLAWEDPPLRQIASYFLGVEFSRVSTGTPRSWSRKIYSDSLRKKISLSKLNPKIDWEEWATSIE
ncbi:hypothetical protein IF690_24055 [Pseudomonas sp. SK3(2021)]|uniref:DUF6602 domain-containing protein n=1 Tax=Pseudomonas sp. SK3(2021) TaxID=2841064 RepID=UPI00192A9E2A|nr:DUF6602 domain-containing protein [Pseudomonas sp. SK3(2021)]QQZ41052.1 hypothetical protein IF690_24055 [Pseudomonas sp. SK3(2021)]